VFERITAPSTEFRDRDLYVFVIGPDHKTVAHGGNARNLGYDLTISGVDYEGKRYGEEMISQASEQGAWVNYKYPDPNTGQVLSKSTWFVLHDGYIFGSRIYKP
jgi:signal transduction histidine kinase